jgi:hypothetical protein
MRHQGVAGRNDSISGLTFASGVPQSGVTRLSMTKCKSQTIPKSVKMELLSLP